MFLYLSRKVKGSRIWQTEICACRNVERLGKAEFRRFPFECHGTRAANCVSRSIGPLGAIFEDKQNFCKFFASIFLIIRDCPVKIHALGYFTISWPQWRLILTSDESRVCTVAFIVHRSRFFSHPFVTQSVAQGSWFCHLHALLCT